MFLRLRQLCLVAERLDPVVAALAGVLGIEVCHRDPEVARFGLVNALLPIGTSFIEVVAPTVPNTTAGRYLERRKGDGGYMVILDTESLGRWRSHAEAVGVRVAAALALGDYEGAQLHPRDTGGALLEINTTRGNADVEAAYWPAGPQWRAHVRSERVRKVTGAVLQADDPSRLAARWGEILQRPAARHGSEWRVAVDNAQLRFIPPRDDRGEGLAGIDIDAADPAAIRAAAEAHGCPADASGVALGGVRFDFTSGT